MTSVISGDIASWEVSTTCNGWGRETDRRNTAPAHSLIESPDACVTGTTPLPHVQASSLDSAYCELSRAAMHDAQESHVAGDDAIDALVTGATPLPHVHASSLDSAYCELSRAAVVHAAHESHVAGDNAIDAPVTGTTPLLHVQASSLDVRFPAPLCCVCGFKVTSDGQR